MNWCLSANRFYISTDLAFYTLILRNWATRALPMQIAVLWCLPTAAVLNREALLKLAGSRGEEHCLMSNFRTKGRSEAREMGFKTLSPQGVDCNLVLKFPRSNAGARLGQMSRLTFSIPSTAWTRPRDGCPPKLCQSALQG